MDRERNAGRTGREGKCLLVFNRECYCSFVLALEPYTTKSPVTNTHVSTVVVLWSCRPSNTCWIVFGFFLSVSIFWVKVANYPKVLFAFT